MSTPVRKNYQLTASAIAFVAAGLPISTASAWQINFFDPSFLILWLGLGLLASFGTNLIFTLKPGEMAGSFAVGYTLAVIIRFVADILINNYTRSNLSMILLVTIATGLVAGWLGSVLWKMMKRSRNRNKKKKK